MTTPTGKLAWGQAGLYDAADDRAVISAVTKKRLGLVWPVSVTAGAGLQIIVRGGWLGVASCGDETSAVVGSREDNAVVAVPGPATGSRNDLIWCDTSPDEGTWELRVITAAAAAGRSGLPLVEVTVPANANLASQMDLRPVDASIERRLMAFAIRGDDTTIRNANTWEQATATGIPTNVVTIEPGQWYRIRYTLNNPVALTGTLQMRTGIGWRVEGQPQSGTLKLREGCISMARYNEPQSAELEYLYRMPVTAPAAGRWVYEGRVWLALPGTYRMGSIGSTFGGYQASVSVEDIGS